MQEVVGTVEDARVVIEQLTTTRGRLAMTALVLLGALVIGVVVVPFAVGQVRRSLTSRYMSGYVADSVELVGDYVPTTMSGLAVRALQVSVVILSALVLLVVWGLFDVAVVAGALLIESIPYLWSILTSLALLLIGVIAFDQLRNLIGRLSDRSDHMTDHQQEIVLRVSQVAIFLTVGVAILGIWTDNLSGLFVGAGFLGIVVGMAARQTLGSLISGFVLMFSRPFTIGDWVQIGDDEGIVTDITMFNTRLENFDGEFLVIPNDKVGDSSVTNRSQKGLLRLRTDVGVDYDSDPDHAMEVAREAMADLEEVVENPAPQVVPKEFGDSAVVLELRYWIDHPTPPRRWAAVSAVVRAVKSAFEKEGIEIPFPQRTMSARDHTTLDAGGDVLPGGPVTGDSENGHTAESAARDHQD